MRKDSRIIFTKESMQSDDEKKADAIKLIISDVECILERELNVNEEYTFEYRCHVNKEE